MSYHVTPAILHLLKDYKRVDRARINREMHAVAESRSLRYRQEGINWGLSELAWKGWIIREGDSIAISPAGLQAPPLTELAAHQLRREFEARLKSASSRSKASIDVGSFEGENPVVEPLNEHEPLEEAEFETAEEFESEPGIHFGADYREADEVCTRPDGDPFEVDPAVVERGLRGHAVTQNLLARYLRSAGIVPKSPHTNDINFDILWVYRSTVFVAEVKSLTNQNEEKQLRLGLGQVLRYAHQMNGAVPTVPILVVERRPSDPTWADLCQQLGVVLAWPEVFSSLLEID